MRGMKKIGSALSLAGESISFAFDSFLGNRMRGFLSLLGVCTGIFCITAAMTVVDSLERSLRRSLESFGGNAVFIEKIPLEPDLTEEGVFRWWKYLGRPEPSHEEYVYLKEKLAGKASAAYSTVYEGGKVAAVSEGWQIFIRNAVSKGREFTAGELSAGSDVAIIGANVVEEKGSGTIYLAGKPVVVIGVFEKSGMGAVDMYDTDNAIVVPYNWAKKSGGMKAGKSTITLMPSSVGENNETIAEAEACLRAFRRLKPWEPSDFSMNRLSFLKDEIEHLFGILGSIAWIIGLFSLLAGGFGVANIMFVSVKERTCEIGLQKAVGATNFTILMQYLSESSFISLAGGIAGIVPVFIASLCIPSDSLTLTLSVETIIRSILTSLVIGILSGLAPAFRAACLQPALALNKK